MLTAFHCKQSSIPARTVTGRAYPFTNLMKKLSTAIGMIATIVFVVLVTATSSSASTSVALAPRRAPVSGEARVVTLVVSFPDTAASNNITPEAVNEMMYSTAGDAETTSGLDSVHSYYYRSSLGKLNITGNTYAYTTQNPSSQYTTKDDLLTEVIEKTSDLFSLSDYDADNSGYVDGMVIVFDSYFASCSGSGVYGLNSIGRDGKLVGDVALISCTSVNVKSLVHETCHFFGVADIYSGVSVNIEGAHAESIMTTNNGEQPCITRYLLGWMTETNHVSSFGVTNCSLTSSSTTSQMTLIYPNGDLNSNFVYAAEYVTPEKNNAKINVDTGGGLRIWQVYLNKEGNLNLSQPDSMYFYIDAMHSAGEEYHYYKNDESVTPYSTPATFTATAFDYRNGDAYPSDMSFSGITISDIKIADGKADFKVIIEEAPSITSASFEYLLTEAHSLSVLDSNDMTLMMVSCSVAIKAAENQPYLIDNNGNKTFLETIPNPDLTSFNVVVKKESFYMLDGRKSYSLVIPDNCFKTSYETGNVQKTFAISIFDFLLSAEEITRSTVENANAPILLYKTPNGKAMSVSYDVNIKKYACCIIDAVTLKCTKKILEFSEIQETVNETYCTSLSDGSFVIIQRTGNTLHMNKYDQNGLNTHSSDLTLNIKFANTYLSSIKGTYHDTLLIEEKTGYYALDLLAMEKTSTPFTSFHGIKYVQELDSDKYLAVGIESAYIANNTEILASVGSGNVLTQTYSKDHYSLAYKNGKIYLFSIIDEQLSVFTYDTSLNLISTEIICNDFPVLFVVGDINTFVTDKGFVLSFNAVLSSYTTAYCNSFLIYLDTNFLPTSYYVNGPVMPEMDGLAMLINSNNIVLVTKNISVKIAPRENTGCVNHEYKSEVVLPKCTEQGYTTHECAVCGYSYIDGYTAARGHCYSTPSYNGNGTHSRICVTCGDAVCDSCSYTITVMSPTCTEQGYTTYTCSNCGNFYINNYVAATGHRYSAPVYNEDNTHSKTCSVCKNTVYENCSCKEVKYNPTCNEQGYTSCTCSTCGHKSTKDFVLELGHVDDNKDGRCDRCSTSMPMEQPEEQPAEQSFIQAFIEKIKAIFQKLFSMFSKL